MDHFNKRVEAREQTVDESKLVLVTGATGLLGNNLVRQLREQGYRVRALVRSLEKARRYLADVELELVEGDMARVDDFARALEGCHAVFHTAAYFREYYQPGQHDSQLDLINVQGTLALMRAADARGVSCFVHTSSSGAVGMKPDGSPGHEGTPVGAEQLKNRYFASKVEGDRQIQAYRPASGMRVVEVLPGFMWGPGDAAPTSSGQLALDFVARKIPVLPEGGLTVVDARDVAHAMIGCLQRAEHGARFIVAGEFRTMEQVFYDLERASGVRAPRLRLPFVLVLLFAWFEELRARVTGGKLLVSREAMRLVRSRHSVSSARAERELGVRFRPFEQTLRDVLAWYAQHDMLPPQRCTHRRLPVPG